MSSLDQSKDAHADSTLAQPQPQSESNAASDTSMPSWYSMLPSQGGTPAALTALPDASEGSTGCTAPPYPSADQLTMQMPMPGYNAAPQITVSSFGQDSSALNTDNAASAPMRELGLVVSTNERAPDESINLLADIKVGANGQSAVAQVSIIEKACDTVTSNEQANRAAIAAKYLSITGQVRAIVVGLLVFACGLTYMLFDFENNDAPVSKKKKGGNLSACGYLASLVMLSGISCFSVLRNSRVRPCFLFYTSILVLFISLVMFVMGAHCLYNEEVPRFGLDLYEKRVFSDKIKMALSPVLFVLAFSQMQLIYLKLRDDAVFLCSCVKLFLRPANRATAAKRPKEPSNGHQTVNEVAASV